MRGHEIYFSDVPRNKSDNGSYIHKIENEDNVSSSIHILLVEDDKITQTYLRAMFEKMNYKFDIASSGKEALELFDSNYTIILLDIGLPDISGYEVAHLIREKEKTINLSRTPIIVTTAFYSQAKNEEVLKEDIDEFRKKITSFQELIAIIDKWSLKILE